MGLPALLLDGHTDGASTWVVAASSVVVRGDERGEDTRNNIPEQLRLGRAISRKTMTDRNNAFLSVIDGGHEPRAKVLRKSESGCHALHFGATQAAGNDDPAVSPATAQPLSSVRQGRFVVASEVFRSALAAAGVNQVDVAIAIGVSTTIVSRWCTGRATIPADCVWILMERLPVLGIEILVRCGEQLPDEWRGVFKQRVAEMG